jgi:FkbM family methyltransferase
VIRVNDAVVITELEGHLVAAPASEWRLVAYFAFRGFPEPGLLKAFRSVVRPGMVVVDVGAHLGLYTLEAARALCGFGRIYSFEPAPDIFALLMQNIQLNGYRELEMIHARSEAVLDRQGTAILFGQPQDSGNSTLFRTPEVTETVDVITVSLDDALDDEAKIDVVKIDAEGAEPWILQGMSRILARSPGIHIFMEFAGTHLRRAGVDPFDFFQALLGMGFQIKRVDDLTGDALDCAYEELSARQTSNLWLRLV